MLLFNESRMVHSYYPKCIASTVCEIRGVSECSSELRIVAGLVRTCRLLVRFMTGRASSGFYLVSGMGADVENVVSERMVTGVLIRESCSDTFPTGMVVRGS